LTDATNGASPKMVSDTTSGTTTLSNEVTDKIATVKTAIITEMADYKAKIQADI